jgi:hypothetical protein
VVVLWTMAQRPMGHRLRVNVGSCRRVTRARDLREISRPTAIPIPPRIAPTTGMPAIKMMTNIDSSIGGMPRGTMECRRLSGPALFWRELPERVT